MSFRSLIQEMRDEFGSISRHTLRSRSHRSAGNASRAVAAEPSEAMDQSCWAQLPPELLREVLVRIEASESWWPARRDVLSCAGVCRTWRGIMKEAVRVPEVSGKLTFPISLKQVCGLRSSLLVVLDINCCWDGTLKCFIRRNRTTQTYYLYIGLTEALADDGKFLLAARKCRKPTCTDYLISLDKVDMSKGSSTYIGKLRSTNQISLNRSNFLGTKFTVYDAHPPYDGAVVSKSRSARVVGLNQVSPRIPAGNYPVSHISYELNVLGSRGPRRMNCVMDSIPASALVASKDNGSGNQENDKVILQFGKIGKDLFTMDYCYPISAFQAFAICLSSFDTKIACE
ncbi:hypothetical protein HU200_023450 [Digitaria exilis]|uniref:Tubby C-terminal domain-containing protein n=1 Tax=Digitaria exilis TaxID=1010633 RepID=A0A835EWS8_9POAL|nr:hypothetical protein HU200_023450 [Digitaria exilis]